MQEERDVRLPSLRHIETKRRSLPFERTATQHGILDRKDHSDDTNLQINVAHAVD